MDRKPLIYPDAVFLEEQLSKEMNKLAAGKQSRDVCMELGTSAEINVCQISCHNTTHTELGTNVGINVVQASGQTDLCPADTETVKTISDIGEGYSQARGCQVKWCMDVNLGQPQIGEKVDFL